MFRWFQKRTSSISAKHETQGENHEPAHCEFSDGPSGCNGGVGLSQPPIDDIESYWSPSEKAQVARMLARSIIGSPETVRSGIEALVAETGADELIVVSDLYDHTARLRSFELIAYASGVGAERQYVQAPALAHQ